eukprot:5261805-Heterocapsa_arctica.AAC.1
MENNPDGPAPKRRMMEGRRSAPPTFSAPSNSSTRAPEANPAVIWMFGFPFEMMQNKLKQFATAAIEKKMPG